MSDQSSKALVPPLIPKEEIEDEDHYEIVQVLNPDQLEDESNGTVAAEVVRLSSESQGASGVDLDLVNFTLVRCDSEGDSEGKRVRYRLMAPDGSYFKGNGAAQLISGETVCVLEEPAARSEPGGEGGQYLTVVDGGDSSQGALVIMEYPDEKDTSEEQTDTSPALLAQVVHHEEPPVRRRLKPLPPTQAMLSSANFRLYIYSCRQCSFKCNAIKQLSEHKKTEHSWRSGLRWKNGAGSKQPPSVLQCSCCPYIAFSKTMLQKHTESVHTKKSPGKSTSDKTAEVARGVIVLNMLVCAACGFESKDKNAFKKHVHRHKMLGK